MFGLTPNTARIQSAMEIEQKKEDARLLWAKLTHTYAHFQKNRILGLTLVRESFGKRDLSSFYLSLSLTL